MYSGKRMDLKIDPNGFDIDIDTKEVLVTSLTDKVIAEANNMCLPYQMTLDVSGMTYVLSLRKFFDSVHSRVSSVEYCVSYKEASF